jgi:hypothetical protein
MTKTNLLKFHCFCHWSILIFVIVSDFGFRIFDRKPGVFVQVLGRGFEEKDCGFKVVCGSYLLRV